MAARRMSRRVAWRVSAAAALLVVLSAGIGSASASRLGVSGQDIASGVVTAPCERAATVTMLHSFVAGAFVVTGVVVEDVPDRCAGAPLRVDLRDAGGAILATVHGHAGPIGATDTTIVVAGGPTSTTVVSTRLTLEDGEDPTPEPTVPPIAVVECYDSAGAPLVCTSALTVDSTEGAAGQRIQRGTFVVSRPADYHGAFQFVVHIAADEFAFVPQSLTTSGGWPGLVLSDCSAPAIRLATQAPEWTETFSVVAYEAAGQPNGCTP